MFFIIHCHKQITQHFIFGKVRIWWTNIINLLTVQMSFKCNDGSGSKFFDLGWVSHLWVREISPKNPFFHFFPSGQKKSQRVKSTQAKGIQKINTGWMRAIASCI